MKYVIAAVMAIVVAIGGYAVYARYEQHKFLESIAPLVKNVSLNLANAVRYETEKETKITYKELFEKLESDVSEIDKRIIDVQTIATNDNKAVTDPVLAYLKGSQELLRALLNKYRKQLGVSLAREWAKSAVDELDYSREYTIKPYQKAVNDLEKAVTEYDEAITDVLGAGRKMKDARAKVAPFVRSDALIEVSLLEAIAKNNEKKPIDAASDEKK
jgi:hypothetical protein